MFRFYIARQRYDAYLVADRLNQAGIRAHVFNQHASSIVGDVPPDVAQPQVWLERECDRERAEVMLRSIEADAVARRTAAAPRAARNRRATSTSAGTAAATWPERSVAGSALDAATGSYAAAGAVAAGAPSCSASRAATPRPFLMQSETETPPL